MTAPIHLPDRWWLKDNLSEPWLSRRQNTRDNLWLLAELAKELGCTTIPVITEASIIEHHALAVTSVRFLGRTLEAFAECRNWNFYLTYGPKQYNIDLSDPAIFDNLRRFFHEGYDFMGMITLYNIRHDNVAK